MCHWQCRFIFDSWDNFLLLSLSMTENGRELEIHLNENDRLKDCELRMEFTTLFLHFIHVDLNNTVIEICVFLPTLNMKIIQTV